MRELYYIVFFLICYSPLLGQDIKNIVSLDAIGKIYFNNNTLSGTGFVMERQDIVVTCAHNIISREGLVFQNSNGNRYPLELLYINDAYDVAVLKSNADIMNTPFMAHDRLTLDPRITIMYVGFDSKASPEGMFKAWPAHIMSIGNTRNENGIARFYEFPGSGIPGYSGSPLFDGNNKVLGIITKAFYMTNYGDTTSYLINRAFSIDPALEFIKNNL